MRHPVLRASALTLAAALVGLAAAPASAAHTVARASASAAVVTVAGTPTDSGTYSVSNDGTSETATGAHRPLASALTGQAFTSAGVLTQDAATTTSGTSAACAGVAGEGSVVAAVGDGQCLTPAGTLTLNAGRLDLSHLQIVRSTLLQGLDQQVQTALQPVLDQVVGALQGGLQSGLRQLGDPGLFVGLGAVESRCTAAPGTADGSATLADVGAYVQVGGQRVDLLSLPAHPAPNTKISTGLGDVATAVGNALRSQLATALAGSLGPLSAAVDQAAVLNTVLANIGGQLAPLDQNVLTGTLNRQVRRAGSIEVTALDLQVLPAAAAYGPQPLSVQLGRSTCGPDERVAPVVRPRPAAQHHTPARKQVVGLLVLAAGAGALDFRRHLGRGRRG